MKTILVTPKHFLRRQVELCIGEIYGREYGASLADFPNTLIAAFDRDDMPAAAAGLRFASSGFFSESYLAQPIEKTLSKWTGRNIERDRIFEVTTLVSRSTKASIPFLREIIAFGEASGFDWAFFTATERLRALLRRIGVPIMVLANADPTRIECSGRWGTYYSCSPQVCAVDGSRLASIRIASRLSQAHA